MGRGNCCSIVCVGHIHVMMESALYTTKEEFDDYVKISHKDEEEGPTMILIQGKNKDYLAARKKINEIFRTASFHRGFKRVMTTSFKVTEFKNQQYSSEFDIEVKSNGEKGKAKVTKYKDNKKKEGKKEQTIMITKKAKNGSIYVRKVTENLIQPLLDGLTKKQIKLEDIVNETKEESEGKCDMCDKKCTNDQGLIIHKSRMHEKKIKVMALSYECDQCEGKFQMKSLLKEHVKNIHNKKSLEVESETMKRVHSTSPGGGQKRKKVEKEKTQIDKVLEEYQKYKKKSEKKYNELKEENIKIKEQLEKLQIEKTIQESKQDVEVKIKNSKRKTEEQEVTVEISESENDNLNECIDRLSSMKLNHMKAMGGQRTCPAEQAAQRKLFPCHLCEFSSDSQNVWDMHLKEKHRNVYTCPFCEKTFSDLNVLKNHIHSDHKENTRQKIQTHKTIPCAFFLQDKGCKKKDNCDFSHEISINAQSKNKIPKLCRNGPYCRWKPSCKYVHPEDGEVIPPREQRMGFGQGGMSRPPPMSQRKPDIRNMDQFPGLQKPMHVTTIWVS